MYIQYIYNFYQILLIFQITLNMALSKSIDESC